MREVLLYGALGKRFGKKFKFAVRSPAEAIAALKANLDGFAEYMIKYSKPGYRVFVGKRNVAVGELHALSKDAPIKIVPVVAGAGGKGVFNVIVGAVLIVAGFFLSSPTLMQVGASIALGGIIQMLTVTPQSQAEKDKNEGQSYVFNGPVNTSAQGNPVPICYGEMLVGSQVVSAGLTVDQLFAVPNATTQPPPSAFPPGYVPPWER